MSADLQKHWRGFERGITQTANHFIQRTVDGTRWTDGWWYAQSGFSTVRDVWAVDEVPWWTVDSAFLSLHEGFHDTLEPVYKI